MPDLPPACPECGTDVQSTWRWCLACGYDPNGLRPVAGTAGKSRTKPALKPRARAKSTPAAPATPAPAPTRVAAPATAPSAAAGRAAAPPAVAPPPGPSRTGRRDRTTPPRPPASPSAPKANASSTHGADAPAADAPPTPDPPPRRAATPADRRLLLVAAAGAAIVVLVAIGLVVRSRSAGTADDATATRDPAPVAWAPYTPPEGGFTVELPNDPIVSTEDMPVLNKPATVHVFTSTAGPDTVRMTYVDLDPGTPAPPNLNEAGKELDRYVVERAGLAGTATIETSSRLTLGANPATNFVVSTRNAGKQRGRAILVGTRIYELAVIGEDPDLKTVERFVKSFALER